MGMNESAGEGTGEGIGKREEGIGESTPPARGTSAVLAPRFHALISSVAPPSACAPSAPC
jgi:hypothetical protein